MHNAVEIPANAAKLLCYIIKNGAIFDLTPLTNHTKYYSFDSADKKETINFNYCKFAAWPENSGVDPYQTFAYVVDKATGVPKAVYTNNSILPPTTEYHAPNYDLGESSPWLTIT